MHLLTAVLLIVTVRTYDNYGVRARDLQTAVRVASRTLSTAGIATEWIECGAAAAPDRCGTAAGRSEIILRIARAPGGQRGGEALGDAAVDTGAKAGSLATLYADRVVAHAAAAGSDPGTLLGRAAAHEIGHLLMGTTDHAPRGLMRPLWSRSDLRRRFERDWLFSAGQAELMRERVTARAAAPNAAAVVVSAELARQQGR